MSEPIKIPTRKTVVDTETGAVIEETTAHFTLMPVEDPHACPDCGRRHEPGQPHDAQSLHYQYTVYGRTGRWPTWKDAIAHCDEATRQVWEDELRRLGHWPEDETRETAPPQA